MATVIDDGLVTGTPRQRADMRPREPRRGRRTSQRSLGYRRLAAFVLSFYFAMTPSACSSGRANWTAGDLELTIDDNGMIVRMVDRHTGVDHRSNQVSSPLLAVQTDGVLHRPNYFNWNEETGIATLDYPVGVSAQLAVDTKQTHLVLELAAIDPAEAVELVVWGPYATTISDTIGETVGVVRDSVFGIGIQALNIKTLGGYPWRDNDFPPQVDLFESGDYSDLSSEGRRYVLYRVEAAKPEDFGSTLQAYCRDRSQDRVIENWNHDQYVAPSYDDGGVVGSKIALFGTSNEHILKTLAAIEVEEGLPHPTIDGEWGKTAPSAAAAYIILDFSEHDVDEAIAWTQRAGLRYLYHPEPFRSWGHFELREDRFPSGRAGLRRSVERAEAEGIFVGIHTLSNFITTNDPYVTPVPDPRLAKVGTSTLAHDIDQRQTEIGIVSPDFFAQDRNNNLRTVVVGNELIQYRSVSEQEPWRLLDCQRGAFGTAASSHSATSEVALLADHAYNVFLTDAALSKEVATNLAGLFNETGVRQISFDGVEGNQSTGMGNYGEILFTTTFYNNLSGDIRQHLIVDASRTTHFFWHIYSRMNWGEPWYAGFRESQTEYRMKNQPYFRRNLMPGMLGWFRMTSQTTIEDVEWMLARSGAFDAGYAFVTSYEALEQNGFTERILEAIGLWERARMADVFSSHQKRRMEAVDTEFDLTANADGFELTQIHPQIVRHERGVRQPGEPTSTSFSFQNPGAEQVLHWIMSAEDGVVSRIEISIDNRAPVLLPVRLGEGWSLRYEGGNSALVLNAEHQQVGAVPVVESAFRIAAGRHDVVLDAILDPADQAKARLELRPRGETESAH
ncbi:MAG: hypothetical protein JSW51_10340 [Gemmatimonadota bacterium]|nr:MAG: hypothetical protein JSW51_10340 [Gemmatimonadota bacterium]